LSDDKTLDVRGENFSFEELAQYYGGRFAATKFLWDESVLPLASQLGLPSEFMAYYLKDYVPQLYQTEEPKKGILGEAGPFKKILVKLAELLSEHEGLLCEPVTNDDSREVSLAIAREFNMRSIHESNPVVLEAITSLRGDKQIESLADVSCNDGLALSCLLAPAGANITKVLLADENPSYTFKQILIIWFNGFTGEIHAAHNNALSEDTEGTSYDFAYSCLRLTSHDDTSKTDHYKALFSSFSRLLAPHGMGVIYFMGAGLYTEAAVAARKLFTEQPTLNTIIMTKKEDAASEEASAYLFFTSQEHPSTMNLGRVHVETGLEIYRGTVLRKDISKEQLLIAYKNAKPVSKEKITANSVYTWKWSEYFGVDYSQVAKDNLTLLLAYYQDYHAKCGEVLKELEKLTATL
jgi:hypothetical protein